MTAPESFGPLFDPEASPPATEALRGLVARDPGAARAAARLLYVDALLRAQRAAPAARPRRLLRPRRRSRWPLLAAAAALAIGIGAYFAFRESPIGEVVAVKGTVRPGAGKVYAGDRLETEGAGSAATIRFADGTTADLNGETRLSRIEEGRLSLDAGTLTVATGRPMVVSTPQAEAKVLGTVFKLSVANQATRLEVRKGQVRITKLEDRKFVKVGADQYAVAAPGQALEVLSIAPATSPGAALAAKMAPGSWARAPGTHLRPSVPDPARYPRIQGITGARGIMESWSGGAFDSRRNRLVVWGGGATNYRGNEIYAFDVQALRWERLTDPTPDPADGAPVNRDGTPNARDTFNGLAYIAHADRFFAMGGSLSGTAARLGADNTWTFDFGLKGWTDRNPTGPRIPTAEGDSCAYVPATRKVWYFNSNNRSGWGLYAYDFDANRWSKETDDHLASRTCAVDARRSLLVAAGRGEVVAFDLRGAVSRENWKTTGGDRLVAAHGPGFDYDSARNRFAGWDGGPVYELDPETKAWTASELAGAPARTPNGIYGRWRYVPGLGVFVVATSVDEDVHFYKPGR